MEVIRGKRLLDIKENTCYQGCTFYISHFLCRVKNCVFENCSFRGESLVIFAVDNLVFSNCNINKMVIKKAITDKTSLIINSGNIYSLNLLLEKVDPRTIFSLLQIPQNLCVSMQPQETEYLQIFDQLPNIRELTLCCARLSQQPQSLTMLRSLTNLETLIIKGCNAQAIEVLEEALFALPKLKFLGIPYFCKERLQKQRCDVVISSLSNFATYQQKDELPQLYYRWKRYLCTKNQKDYVVTTCDRPCEKFPQEISAITRIRHEVLFQICDYHIDHCSMHYITEYFHGKNLDYVIKKYMSLSVHRTCHIALQLLQALEIAHSLSIMHGEIDTDSIFINENGRVRMLWSMPQTNNFLRINFNDSTLPKPYFSTPERIKAAKNRFLNQDTYAIGVLMYFLLCGQFPFQGKSALLSLRKIVNHDYIPLHIQRPQLPKDLLSIISRAMSQNPEARYQTANTMYQDLSHFYQQLS